MKNKYYLLLIALTLLAGINSIPAQVVITSFSQNGVLVCSNLPPGNPATVAWASSLNGPWQTDWGTLSGVTANSNGVVSVSVPMFYRVLVLNPTNGMCSFPPGRSRWAIRLVTAILPTQILRIFMCRHFTWTRIW